MAPDRGVRERSLKHGSPWQGQRADRCGACCPVLVPLAKEPWSPDTWALGPEGQRTGLPLSAKVAPMETWWHAGHRQHCWDRVGVPAQGPASLQLSVVTTLPMWPLLLLSAGMVLVTTLSMITGSYQTMVTLYQALPHMPGTGPRAL